MKKQSSVQREISRVGIGSPREITGREREVARLIAEGYKSREVAEKLGVAVATVNTHRTNVMNKLALRNVAQLIHYAIQKGLVNLEPQE